MGEEYVLREQVTAPLQLHITYIGGDLVLEGSGSGELIIYGEGAQVERLEHGSRINLECNGDCRVRVPMEVSVLVSEVAGDLRASELASPLTLENCQADVIVRALDAPLQVEHVAGDARITEVNTAVQIGTVGADLALRDINGAVSIETVGADLEAKRINGAFSVESVGADACLKEIHGALSIAHVGADAVLTDVLGNCTVEHIGADLALDMPFTAGTAYHFGSVGADVLAKIRSGSAVCFKIPAETEKTINVRGVRLESDTETDTIIVGEYAEGGALVTIDSIGSELQLVSQGKGFSTTVEFSIPDNLGEIISNQISQQLSRLEQTFARQAERMSKRAEEMAQRASRQAERAKERAERHKRGARASRAWTWSGAVDFTPPAPPAPPRPPAPARPSAPAVTDQERMAILRMVEERQITIEEAERLLAALEGRD